MNFMASSLDALIKTLEQEDLRILRSGFQHLNDNEFRKSAKKAYFPYSYLDSQEKCNAPFPVFGIEWRNTLTGKIDISEQQYNEAMRIYELLAWNEFGDYHDAYLKIDVFVLADVFEKFRDVCMKVYQLDPAHFYSAPNLSWDAMLITTKVKIELLDDIDKLLFCEKAIRGGLYGVGSLRFFKANSNYLNTFNEDETSVFGAFFDVTSLYTGIMMKSLPLCEYTWVESVSESDLLKYR